MIEFSPCKINLGLQITAKRPDGFHELSTIMYPIVGKPDIIELKPSATDKFLSSGLIVDCEPTNNLCLKALRLLRTHYNIPPVHIHLHKQIPFGAGLGGGSADATAILKLCNTEFSLALNDEQLENLAAQIGSDTPFFVKNIPQLATGRGEILEPITIDLSQYYIYIVKPSITISTAQAFRAVVPTIPDISLQEIVHHPINQWKRLLKNDFESSLFPLFPQLTQIKNELYQKGALYASLSGSGSALYGIFDHQLPSPPPHFWHIENRK